MKDFNPFSIIENSISTFKDFLDKEMSGESVVTEDFLKEIETENIKLLNLCKELNSDNAFIEKINNRIDCSSIKAWYKTEQIFLSDAISIYDKNKSENPSQAKFVLAYYYDVLRNGHFADKESLQTLNQLVKSNDFEAIISKLKSENQLKLITPTDKNFLLSILSELNHPKLEMMQNHFANFRKSASISGVDEIEIPKNEPATENKVEPVNSNISNPPEGDTLEKALAELNSLVGLEKVKKDITELINLLNIQKKREAEGLKNVEIALHTVFLGPPGTGKTTVARLLSRIFKHLAYLSKGQLYETDREGLIAGYVGQTAIKTDKVVADSIGGVLFIDEAYSLTQNLSGNDFGSEAVNTIIKRMEDNRDDLAVVVAGYTEPMQIFIESNPGLRSRFNRYFNFDHFTTDQLFQIFEGFCTKSDFTISEGAKEKLVDTFSLMDIYKTESFGNARVARNLFEKVVQNQANRLIFWTNPNGEFLKTLVEEDIPEPNETVESIKAYKKEEPESEEEV